MKTIFGVIDLSRSARDISMVGERMRAQDEMWAPNRSDCLQGDHFFFGAHYFADKAMHTRAIASPLLQVDNLVLAGDLRIDNRDELDQAYNSASLSDEELVIRLWKKCNKGLVQKLKGSYAFVIYDRDSHRIFMALDHIGTSNLYYSFEGQWLVFGTLSAVLLASGLVDKTVNWDYIVRRQRRVMDVGDETYNRYVNILLPAHCYEIAFGQLSSERYWRLDIEHTTRYDHGEDYIEEFRSLFRQAIQRRTAGYNRIGSHLSGGLDSSGVTAMAKRVSDENNQQLYSYSYVFDESLFELAKRHNWYNFNHLVEAQIRHSGIKHPRLIKKLKQEASTDLLWHEVDYCGGLSWSNNTRTDYEIVLQAQEDQVGVMLSGFPGDELVTSFCRPYYLEYLDQWKIGRFFTSQHRGRRSAVALVTLFGLKVLDSIGVDINKRGWNAKFEGWKRKFLTRKNLDEYNSELFHPSYVKKHPPLVEALAVRDYVPIHAEIPLSLKQYQRNHIERPWTSRRMMSERLSALKAKVNYCYPLADIDLLQFVISLPVEMKRNEKFGRLIYRMSMDGILVDGIAWGQKESSLIKPAAFTRDTSGTLPLTELIEQMIKEDALPHMRTQHLLEVISRTKGGALSTILPYLVPALMQERQLGVF